MNTRPPLPPSRVETPPTTTETVAHAARLLARGGLVAVPTETVYGLAGDARNPTAIARIFAAKGRPASNPLISHVADLDAARALAHVPPLAERLAAAFWPGPLTLVLPRRADSPVCDLACAGLNTIALRVPAHPLMRQLLAATRFPLAAPSANPSGAVSPTQADHVAGGLGAALDLILDGGPSAVGLESTVVAVAGERATLLRAGGLARSEIEAVTGPLARAGEENASPRSPGQLSRHYAPRAALRLGATTARPGEARLAFGDGLAVGDGPSINLSPTGDLIEAAARLFAALHQLDAMGVTHIAVAPIPDTGLGEAINDRLARAARGRTPAQPDKGSAP